MLLRRCARGSASGASLPRSCTPVDVRFRTDGFGHFREIAINKQLGLLIRFFMSSLRRLLHSCPLASTLLNPPFVFNGFKPQ